MKITYTYVSWDDQMDLVERLRKEAGIEGEFRYFLKRSNLSNDGTRPRFEAGPAFDVDGEEWIFTAGQKNLYKYHCSACSSKEGWMLD